MIFTAYLPQIHRKLCHIIPHFFAIFSRNFPRGQVVVVVVVVVVELFILTMAPSPIRDTFMRRRYAVGGAAGYPTLNFTSMGEGERCRSRLSYSAVSRFLV